MSYKDIYEFIRENITEDEWECCNEKMLSDLICEYIREGMRRGLFTKAKERIANSLLNETGCDGEKSISYGITPERWVMSVFDVDEDITESLCMDGRFSKKIERTLVFDMTASIRDYLRYSAYGKAG